MCETSCKFMNVHMINTLDLAKRGYAFSVWGNNMSNNMFPKKDGQEDPNDYKFKKVGGEL